MSEEISLSVEETNNLRAKLGLKPLRLEPEKDAKDDTPQSLPITKPVVNEKEVREIEEGKRLVSDITTGGGVLDIFDDVGDTSSWLQKQKKAKTIPDGEVSERSAEEKVSESILMSHSRIKLSHDLQDLAERPESILVMKDKSVLDEGSEDEAVEMEELQLADQEKHAATQRRAKHGKKFNPYEDDWDSREEGILSKYDDFDEVEAKRRSQRTRELILGQGVSTHPPSSAADRGNHYVPSEEFPTTMTIGSSMGSSTGRQLVPPVSVEDKLRFQSDFYTEQEAVQFKKIIPKKKNKKRKQDEGDDDMVIKKFEPIVAPEEDEELYAQLSRLRRIEKIHIPNDDYISNVIRESRDADLQQSEAPAATAVSEFVSRIQLPNLEIEEEPAREENMMEEETPEKEQISRVEPEPASEPIKAEPVRESILGDIKVDSGLACALAFFQSRGAVEKESDAKDREVRIEHRDEFGRVLDAKEAYKQLSWKFHGVKPGAAKQEKRLKKIENEIKSKKSSF